MRHQRMEHRPVRYGRMRCRMRYLDGVTGDRETAPMASGDLWSGVWRHESRGSRELSQRDDALKRCRVCPRSQGSFRQLSHPSQVPEHVR